MGRMSEPTLDPKITQTRQGLTRRARVEGFCGRLVNDPGTPLSNLDGLALC